MPEFDAYADRSGGPVAGGTDTAPTPDILGARDVAGRATADPIPADMVLRGGIVHPFVPGREPATALAVRGGRVSCIGGDAQMRDLVGPHTDVIDLNGRAVLPGINDAHLHATWLGALWPQTLFGDDTEPGGDGGRLLHTDEERRRAILAAGDLLASLGVTSYTEPGLGPGEDDGATGVFGEAVVEQYRALATEGNLAARVTVLSLYGEVDGRSDLDTFLAGIADADRTTPDPRRLRFAGVKIFADGIAPMRSAYTHACYTDGSRSHLLVAGETDADREQHLTQMVLAAHRAGLQVGVHATGDRSVEVLLDAVTQARREHDIDLGHYVVHGDLVTQSQLRRMSRLGVGLSTQAGIATRTHGMVEAVMPRTPELAAWPMQDALDAGVELCLTSDAPVLSPDWRQEIAAADQWLGTAVDTRSRMETLLRCYTVHPAAQDGATAWKGTLAPGMVADLCVLESDPFRLSPAELPDVNVDLTILGGAVVYHRTP